MITFVEISNTNEKFDSYYFTSTPLKSGVYGFSYLEAGDNVIDHDNTIIKSWDLHEYDENNNEFMSRCIMFYGIENPLQYLTEDWYNQVLCFNCTFTNEEAYILNTRIDLCFFTDNQKLYDVVETIKKIDSNSIKRIRFFKHWEL